MHNNCSVSGWHRLIFMMMAFISISGWSNPPGFDRLTLSELDVEVQRLMHTEDVKGLAIVLIDGDEIVHVKVYGFRNIEQEMPLQIDIVMYGASLTKTVFAYMVLQLVDEGIMSLPVSRIRAGDI